MKKVHRQLSRKKIRVYYIVAITITIFLGLASRKYGFLLFTFIAENAGDMLWATMVYFGFRFLFVHNRFATAIWLSFIFSFAIKFSQLYQADWINHIRGTLLGALILGKGFLFADLIHYSVGIVFAAFLDKQIIKGRLQ
ncbi:DUF2809 domain-containing protein [Neobacillus sp. SM06]|uniref:ribosomal maturation YjgA family protein n=1 Tax=Neobacillus sp. SM06 TaxID=3422492 RepID=UPI003D2D36C5